jgi:hypothetical protein
MPDAHMWDALDKLVELGLITSREAQEFRGHRAAQKHLLEDAWRRLDDLASAEDTQATVAGHTIDPAAPDARYRALKMIRDCLGWNETEFP